MGDIKLFELRDRVVELDGTTDVIEKSLQTLFERNLQALLGVDFLASEYRTTDGRIDTLGIDENDSPVIIEYKRATNQNVVTQGLFYLDWLLGHRGDFRGLVLQKCGNERAENVDWSAPRLVCIAGDFSRYDEHAIKMVQRNVELIRYRRFRGDLLLLELLTAVSSDKSPVESAEGDGDSEGFRRQAAVSRSVTEYLESADVELKDLFQSLRSHLLSLGDDVQERTLKNYFAFTRIKNFSCVEIKPRDRKILAYVKVDPSAIGLEDGFTRDMREIGHYGTGDLEVTLNNMNDLERAMPLFKQSYDES
jgi:predicted transport protein